MPLTPESLPRKNLHSGAIDIIFVFCSSHCKGWREVLTERDIPNGKELNETELMLSRYYCKHRCQRLPEKISGIYWVSVMQSAE